MAHLAIEIADDLVTAITAVSLGTKTVTRRYSPLTSLEEFASDALEISVIPRGDVRDIMRSETGRTVMIDVAVQRKLVDRSALDKATADAADITDADAVMANVETLATALEHATADNGSAQVTAIASAIWEPRHLAEMRLVTSLLTLTIEAQS